MVLVRRKKVPVSKDGITTIKARQLIRPRGRYKISNFPRKKKKRGENQYINGMYLRFLFSLQHKHQQRGAELKYTSKDNFNFHALPIINYNTN